MLDGRSFGNVLNIFVSKFFNLFYSGTGIKFTKRHIRVVANDDAFMYRRPRHNLCGHANIVSRTTIDGSTFNFTKGSTNAELSKC